MQIWIQIVTIHLLAVGLCVSPLISQDMYIYVYIYINIYIYVYKNGFQDPRWIPNFRDAHVSPLYKMA